MLSNSCLQIYRKHIIWNSNIKINICIFYYIVCVFKCISFMWISMPWIIWIILCMYFYFMYVNEIYATEINDTVIRIYYRQVCIQRVVRNNTLPVMRLVVMSSKVELMKSICVATYMMVHLSLRFIISRMSVIQQSL